MLQRISRGEVVFNSEEASQGYFLPRALEVDGILHVLFGSLERAVKPTPEVYQETCIVHF